MLLLCHIGPIEGTMHQSNVVDSYGPILAHKSLLVRDLLDDEPVSAILELRAAPATANNNPCICGLNSRRTASFCAKLNAQ